MAGETGKQTTFEVYRQGGTTQDIRLTVLLVLVARRWRSLLDDHLRPNNQSSARMEALAAIFNSPPLSPQVDIARRLRIEGPTLTRMIDSLEQDHQVERVTDPADRRTRRLRLTKTGEDELESTFAIADMLRDRLLEGLDDATKAQLNTLLGQMLDRLDTGLPGD